MVSERFEVAADGAVLSAERFGDGSPTLVLLHAGVCDRRSWLGIAERLEGRATLVAYDLRGYGETPPSAEPFSHLDDLMVLLDAVSSGRPAWLVGSSMGGGLAVDAALSAQERVAGLVLLAPAVAGSPDGPLDPATEQILAAVDRAIAAGDGEEGNRLEVRLWLDGPSSPEGRVDGAPRDLALAMNAVIVANDVPEDAGSSGMEPWGRLSEITCPVAVACGSLDLPIARDQSREAASRIPGATFQELPGTAHLPYLEDPAAVAALIAGALT